MVSSEGLRELICSSHSPFSPLNLLWSYSEAAFDLRNHSLTLIILAHKSSNNLFSVLVSDNLPPISPSPGIFDHGFCCRGNGFCYIFLLTRKP